MPIISGTPNGDVLNGTSGDDQIFGLGGGDFITGGDGADYIDGGDGDDFIRGSEGADVMRGGAGADVFAFDGDVQPVGTAYDLIVDFQTGTDRIATIFVPFEISIVRQGGSSFVFMRSFNGAGLSVITAFGDINARDFGDIDRQGGAITMVGSAATDVLIGGAGRNYIFGGPGDDRIDGGAGDDVLYGGGATLFLGDTLTGGAGRDFFVFTAGSGGGLSTITDFTRGDDRLIIQPTSDTQSVTVNFQSSGVTEVVATGSAARINGVFQPADMDIDLNLVLISVWDYSGDRIIIGGTRAESLWGGSGRDIIEGGGGADQFLYFSANESTASAMDIIVDFQSGVDRIVLDDRSGFSAATVFNVAYNSSGAFVFVDTQADGVYDMVIGLMGVTRLAAGDIAVQLRPTSQSSEAAPPPQELFTEGSATLDMGAHWQSGDWYLTA